MNTHFYTNKIVKNCEQKLERFRYMFFDKGDNS